MELLIFILGFLLLLRLGLGTPLRGAILLFVLLVGIQLLGRVDPQLTAALAGPLLLLFVVLIGLRVMTKGLIG